MAHAQKPDLVFQRNGRVHLIWRGGHFSRLLAAEVCASAVVMLDTPCSEVECKTTGYPLHSHVSPLLPLPCGTVCHQVSTELYLWQLYSLKEMSDTWNTDNSFDQSIWPRDCIVWHVTAGVCLLSFVCYQPGGRRCNLAVTKSMPDCNAICAANTCANLSYRIWYKYQTLFER